MNTVKELNIQDLSMVSGGVRYSVDESVFGVPEFIAKCKEARANDMSNGTALGSNSALDWLWGQYVSHGLEDRLDEWGYGDLLERYYFENPMFM